MGDMSSTINFIKRSFDFIQDQIPSLENEALDLIKRKCADIRQIEYCLDTLHSLRISGFEVKAQNSLIKFLAKLNPELAEWHRDEFDKEI